MQSSVQDVHCVQEERDKLRKSVHKLEADAASHSDKMQNRDAAIAQLKTDKQELSQRASGLDGTVRRLQQQLASADSGAGKASSQIESLEAEVDKLESQIEALQIEAEEAEATHKKQVCCARCVPSCRLRTHECMQCSMC